MARAPRNRPLKAGVYRLSRTAVVSKKAVYKKKRSAAKKAPVAKVAAAAPAVATKTKTVGGAKNGKTRVVPAVKASRWYPAEDAPKPKASRKAAGSVAPLRSSITPGTVLIMLAGRFRGKRVVCLKQLKSGLLLVTGPYKVNGVPLRRVNQAYVIATSTKLDISKVKVADKIDDAYFKKDKAQASKKTTAAELFAEAQKKKVISSERVADQKAVDSQLLPLIKKTPTLKAYLNASFALNKGQAPHMMKF